MSGASKQHSTFTLRAYSPDSARFVDFAVQADQAGALPPVTVGPGDVTGTSGVWHVFLIAANNGGQQGTFSANHRTITVTPPSAPTSAPASSTTPTSASADATPAPKASATPTGDPAGCVGQDRGNVGQLTSPRVDESNAQRALPRNIALGLDHCLDHYPAPGGSEVVKSCETRAGGVVPGGRLDDRPGSAGDRANCIMADPGNDGPKTYDGLVAGTGGGVRGRLDVHGGATRCPGRPPVSVDGVEVNNDTLACFLRNGATLASIARETGVDASMLDPAIVTSPRFVYLPVVHASDRAQKTYQPIRSFVPGFITSETTTTGAPSSGINGLDVNGRSVKVLRVFVFNRDALPPSETSESADFDPALGRGVVRLVG